ncbi:MAG: SWIM zinc finger family protein [Synergistaceae bacterium]|nr:SWIM zinc finger family protein [Synergistaceae bacterium]
MMSSFEREEKFYKYRKPRETKCGIKSRTARGHVYGSNWWSRRWVEVMERCIDSGRLARGKSYARKGQVVNIQLEPGLVTAFVQGSRKTPYQIRFGFETVSSEARELILFRFRESAALAAKLLAGEMPEEIETIFKEAGTPLFPTQEALRRFKCTCPDDASPCKHIIAVLLILGEELEDDPFLLLKLRGLDKESLINLLTLENAQEGELAEESGAYYEWVSEGELSGGAEAAAMSAVIRDEEPSAGEDWFRGGEFSCERVEQEGRRAAALDVMNDFPFWRGEHPFRQTLAPFYEHAAVYACEILTGEKKKPVGRPRKLI